MALNGSISTSGWSSSSGSTWKVVFNWTATQNVANNTSTIAWNLKSSTTSGKYVVISELRVKFGGEQIYYRDSSNHTNGYNGTLLANGTKTITHNNDGTKSFTVSVEAGIYDWPINRSGSGTITLNTIPRNSKINSFSGVSLTGGFSVNYTSYSSSFTNKLRISVPNVKALETFNYTSGTNFTLSQTSLDYLYSYTSNTDKVKLGAVIETWNGSSKIGESEELVNECNIPSTDAFLPSIGTITLDPVDINGQNILVQGKNQITVSVSECKAGMGSSIKSYTISGPGISYTGVNSYATSNGAIFSNGDITYTISVTDYRQRTVSKTATINCYEYFAPHFTSFNAYRVESSTSTTANDNGSYVRCTYDLSYASVNDTNDVDVLIYYKKGSDNWNSITVASNSTDKTGAIVLSDVDNDATYTLYAEVIDNYSGSSKSTQKSTFSTSRILNIRPQGKGIAFGKMAETDNLFESRWPAQFNEGISVGISTQDTTPNNGILVHDVRSATITPNSFGDKNVNFYFDQINNKWVSALHMKGWSDDYAAWELAGNANNSLEDNSLKYRQGRIDTWGDWQTVITDKNIGNYIGDLSYLPTSGGTLNGLLNAFGGILLPQSYFYTSSKYGLNCNDSDIVNINGMYFADSSNSAGEGINFVGSTSEKWDTLYTDGGKLKFHPNRAINGAFDGQILYTSSNFRCGLCTLSSSSNTTITFTSSFTSAPTVMLTPITDETGVITGKLRSVTASGFTATIGGSTVSSAQFMYFAIL